jgi:hypothetical protein
MVDFMNRVNSIEVNAKTCEIKHAFEGPKKGVIVTDATAGKTFKTIRGVVPIDQKGNAFFVPDKNEVVRIPAASECVVKTDSKRRLLLNNAKTVFQLR